MEYAVTHYLRANRRLPNDDFNGSRGTTTQLPRRPDVHLPDPDYVASQRGKRLAQHHGCSLQNRPR